MRPRSHHAVAAALVALALITGACASDDAAPPTTALNGTVESGTSRGAKVPRGGVAPGSTVTTPAGDVEHPTNPSGDFPPVDNPRRDGSLSDVHVKITEIATLAAPTILVARPRTDELFVGERAGTVRVLHIDANGAATVGPMVALDITKDTTDEVERGLLGLAFSADGSHLYVSHTNIDGNSRLEDYRMDGDVAVPTSKRVLLAQEQPFPNHNGGNVVLGPDGKLWFGLGDGGGADDQYNYAQHPDDPLGKMLIIDPARPAHPEFWALGLRNPWRFSFDRKTHDLWIGDVGQDQWEEIDWVPAGSKAGLNFGWSGYEGSRRYKIPRVPAISVPPVFEMQHSDRWCSVTGGVVYRGTRIPALDGAYLFSDYCRTGLYGLRLTNGAVTDERALGPMAPQVVSINEDLHGDVFLISLQGGIYRLDPA